MPSRLLREGILTSERIDQLDPGAEVFYRRLMSKVDDHGLYDARPSILRAHLFPLRVDRVREADIARWIAACEKAGLIVLYQHAGKALLQMLDTGWQVRSEPKYPLPPERSCKQVQTTVHLDGVEDGVVFVPPPSVSSKPTEEAGAASQSAAPPPPPAFDGLNAETLNGKAVVPLSAEWQLPEDWGLDAEALGWKPGEVVHEAEKFRQYWTAGKGSGTRRAVRGWRQTWSNWLSKAAERKQR